MDNPVVSGPLARAFFNYDYFVLRSPEKHLDCRPVALSPLGRFEGQNAVVNGKLYVFGGFRNRDLKVTSRSDFYDPLKDSWG